MPYELQRDGDGYSVVSKDSGTKHSKKPLTHQKASAQMRALYANEPDATKPPGFLKGGKFILSKTSGSNVADIKAKGKKKAKATAPDHPPVMALANAAPAPGLKKGGKVRFKTTPASKGGPNSSGLFNGQKDFKKTKPGKPMTPGM